MKAIKITAYTEDRNQIEAFKAVMKAMKIKFGVDRDKSPYDPEFVEKIKQGDVDLENERGRSVTLEELDNLWK